MINYRNGAGCQNGLDVPLFRELYSSGTDLIEPYIEALKSFGGREGLIGVGADSAIIRLKGKKILKLSKNKIGKERPFDLPAIEKGTFFMSSSGSSKIEVHYSIQHEAEMRANNDDLSRFEKYLKAQGYRFKDRDISQIGFFRGELYLVDYFAVEKDMPIDLGEPHTGFTS